jgi:hypothetical protein
MEKHRAPRRSRNLHVVAGLAVAALLALSGTSG